MKGNESLVQALRQLKVETGSLVCMGCGHEHGCSVHGCAIIQEAVALIENLKRQIDALLRENGVVRSAMALVDGQMPEMPVELLDMTFPENPKLMKNVRLAIRYESGCGIIFHMDYEELADLLERGIIKEVNEEKKELLRRGENG